MYANGHGTPQDEAQALIWFRKAADQGNADAQNGLGVMYSTGHGARRTMRKRTCGSIWLPLGRKMPRPATMRPIIGILSPRD
jgi:hypothetical protein